MLSSVLMIAVVAVLHPVLADPTDEHLTQAALRTLISHLEASLASKDVALQALASGQSRLAREFETCSAEQVKLHVGQQATNMELAKLGERYRHLEAEKHTTDRHSMLLMTDNSKLMERVSQLGHANEHLLAEKISLEKTLSSLQDEYTATLQDSEAVHKKLLRSIKRSKLVKKRLTKRLITEKNQREDLQKEKETTARKLLQTIKDIFSDVRLNSETLDVSSPAEVPQDVPDLPGVTRTTEDKATDDDTLNISEQTQGKVHQEELYKQTYGEKLHKETEEEELHIETGEKNMAKELNRDATKNYLDHSDDDDDYKAINSNGREMNEGKSDKRQGMETGEDDNNVLMNLLQTNVDESAADSPEDMKDFADEDNTQVEKVNDERKGKESDNVERFENTDNGNNKEENNDNERKWKESERKEELENVDTYNDKEEVNDGESEGKWKKSENDEVREKNIDDDRNEEVEEVEARIKESENGDDNDNDREAEDGNETKLKDGNDKSEEFQAQKDKDNMIINEQRVDNNNNNDREAEDGNETKLKDGNDKSEEFQAQKDKDNTMIIEQRVENNEGLEITGENYNNEKELNDNEKGWNEEYKNEGRKGLQVGNHDYSGFVDSMRSIVDADSLPSIIDELDKRNENNPDDGNWDQLNDEEEQKYEKRNRKSFRDEI